MKHAVGSLVSARGRDWLVLPDSSDDLLMLRPLGGSDEEVTGILSALEDVESASFDLPDPSRPGDYRSCRLLRDAVRLGFRSSAGPFRSFARIAVDPRPYQLVPLLMALKLDPVRILIADDVGIGKTVEAGLIARELLDRGEARRLAVLCPPHLAEQWQAELREKFHIDAELVLSSSVRKLERNCGIGKSVFDVYPHVIVSLDYIKADKRRDDFIRSCPELLIVDEAHTCAFGEEKGKQLRNKLVSTLAESDERHMVFVTATPHSGKEQAFRSLLSFLRADFTELPDDLTGSTNEQLRRQVAAHFVQRRRADIKQYLDVDTPFPERLEKEETYSLSPEYKALFEKVLDYCRDTVLDPELSSFKQRVRWWSALGLLRALASSPAAAAATMRSRATTSEAGNKEEADDIGRRTVMDLMDDEASEGMDIAPGGECDDAETSNLGKRLKTLAREADKVIGDSDQKLTKAIKLIKALLKDGHNPIVFCRFIDTAEYVAEALREATANKVEVAAVTGRIPPAERESRVEELGTAAQRILVCTDCLSEGINLQDNFDAVFHYDLPWNPTRLEQREGRVDRYGQPSDEVRILTYYGVDNQIDGIVLNVLIRKHKNIRSSLGISVPVPIDSETVMEAVLEGLLLREKATGRADQQFFDFIEPKKAVVHDQWQNAADREKTSRTMFAQASIKVDEVQRELESVRAAIGAGVDTETFTIEGLKLHGATVSRNGHYDIDVTEMPRSLKDSLLLADQTGIKARFELPVSGKVQHLNRTHPIVEGLARYVMDTAFDPELDSCARRCGVIVSSKVEKRTTLLLMRLRYQIVTRRGTYQLPMLAEDCALLGFTGSPDNAAWLGADQVDDLTMLTPDENISPDVAAQYITRVRDGYSSLMPELEHIARDRAEALLEAHRRVRAVPHAQGLRYTVEPKLPADVLGIYVYLPKD
jgi:superfamily II DNA or RNA helicase